MSLLNFSTPNLVGGISQQSDQLLLPGQVVDCTNFVPHPTEGLIRRNPCWYSGKTASAAATSCYVHWINRDSAERYCVVVSDANLKVFGLDGQEYLVRAPGGASPASFTYLDIATATNAPTKYKALTVADFTFIVNKEVRAVESSTPTSVPNTAEAYLWVRAGNYNTLHTATIKFDGGSDKTFQVYVGAAPNAYPTGHGSRRFYRITTVGAIGSTWTLTFSGGASRVYTVLATDTLDTINQNLSGAFATLSASISSTADAYGLEIAWDGSNAAFGYAPPTLVSSSGGAFTELPVLTSVATDRIAQTLSDLIDADTDLVSSTKGSVIKVTKATSLPYFVKFEVTDSQGDTAIVPINRKVENPDDLPPYCTDGYQCAVIGNAGDTDDDYWVRFAADETAAFGSGAWNESLAYGSLSTLTASTFPHQLIRKQNTALNVPVVGLPAGGIYFEFGPMSLSSRTVGDNNHGRFPGIGDGFINDIFFFKNRLGLLSGQAVLLSEAGRYFNFYPTTVRQVLDSDPIGITAAHTKVSYLYSAVPFEDQLILWSDRTQFRLQGDPILSPKTASIQPVAEFQNIATVTPATVGRTILFSTNKDAYSGLSEFYSLGDGVRYDAVDATIQVPSLIFGPTSEIVVCPAENTAVVRAGTASTLYLYRYLWEGQEKVQSSWTKLRFHTGSILGVGVFDANLYLLVRAGSSSYICRLSLKSSSQFEDLVFPYMDFLLEGSAIDPGDIIYDPLSDTTDITIPFVPQTLDNDGSVLPKQYSVIDARGATRGANIPILAINTNTITVAGNLTPSPTVRWYVGSIVPASVQLPKAYIRSESRSAAYLAGNLRLRYGAVSFRNSGSFAVRVVGQGTRDISVSNYSGYIVSNNTLGSLALTSGSFRFPVYGRNLYTDIYIQTEATQHLALTSIEWEAEYNAKSTRFGR